MEGVLTSTLAELIARLRLEKLSPVELTTAVLARIDGQAVEVEAIRAIAPSR